MTSPTADPGVTSWIPEWSQTFMEIDLIVHVIISLVNLHLKLIQEGLLSVTGFILE